MNSNSDRTVIGSRRFGQSGAREPDTQSLMSLCHLPPPPPFVPAQEAFFRFTSTLRQTQDNVSPNLIDSLCGSPTFFRDNFMMGEVPFEANGREIPEAQIPISEPQIPFPVRPIKKFSMPCNFAGRSFTPRSFRQRPKFNYCVFCKTNGEDESFFLSHTLKDDHGCVTCPILYAYTCPMCNASGPVAHTLRYCPKAKEENPYENIIPISEILSMKNAAGTYRQVSGPYGHPGSRTRAPSKQTFVGPNAAWTGIRPKPVNPPCQPEPNGRDR